MRTKLLTDPTFVAFLAWLMHCEGGVDIDLGRFATQIHSTPSLQGRAGGGSALAALASLFNANRNRMFSNDPADHGGPTMCGITLRLMQEYNNYADANTLRAITFDDWAAIYAFEFWCPMRCHKLPADVAFVVADFAVNSGPRRAARFLQKAYNKVKPKVAPTLSEDGIIGTATICSVHALIPTQRQMLLDEYLLQRTNFITNCVKRGGINRKFLNGLLRRARNATLFAFSV